MNIDEIRRFIQEGGYEITLHAQQERLDDDLDIAEIEQAIADGAVIEDYPQDPRGASCLVAGRIGAKSIHVVLGWARKRGNNERMLRVITVYLPQPPKWKDDRTRGATP